MSEVVESNELHDVLFFLSQFEACFSSIDDVSFLSPHSSQHLHTWPCVFPDLDFVNGSHGAGDLWTQELNYGMNGNDSASSEVERQLKASVMEMERRQASQHHTIHESCMAAQIEEKPEGGVVQFQTRTENEVLDDGYRWRKYGKKNIKNRYYPRSYYRCAESQNGCTVLKHVERCSNDPSILLTTYEGRHNHVASINEASFFLQNIYATPLGVHL